MKKSAIRPFITAPAVLALLMSTLVSTAYAAAMQGENTSRGSEASDTLALRRTLEQITRAYPGNVGISLRNLQTGETLSLRGGEPFPSASLIKVAVLVTLLDEVHAGRLQLEEPITLIARDRVGGSGILQHMTSGHTLTVGEAARLMIVISDNTATNLILDKLDIRTVWSKMEALGLPRSKIHSKSFRRHTSVAMDSSVKYGLGVTTPDETVQLFTLLHQGRAVSPALDSLALGILRTTAFNERLRRWLPPGTAVAHKEGSVDRARNDCGILYGPEAPVALCVMTWEDEDLPYTVDNRANLLIAQVAREVFRHYNPGAELPPVPIRGDAATDRVEPVPAERAARARVAAARSTRRSAAATGARATRSVLRESARAPLALARLAPAPSPQAPLARAPELPETVQAQAARLGPGLVPGGQVPRREAPPRSAEWPAARVLPGPHPGSAL